MHEDALSYTERTPFVFTYVVNLADETHFNQVRFVTQLKTKFRAKVIGVGRYHGETDDPLGWVELEYPGLAESHDAKGHCRAHLDEAGRVRADYIGAFEYADRKARSAKELLRLIENDPFSN